MTPEQEILLATERLREYEENLGPDKLLNEAMSHHALRVEALREARYLASRGYDRIGALLWELGERVEGLVQQLEKLLDEKEEEG